MTVYQTDPDGFFLHMVEPRVLRGQTLIPAGCVDTAPPEIPDGKRARWTGDAWEIADAPAPAEPDPISPPEPQSPTRADVAAERKRRLAMGFSFDFGDGRGVHVFGTTEADMMGWDEVTKVCDLIRRGVLDLTTISISTETGEAEVSPEDWDLVLAAAAAFRQPIWQASFALERLEPVPDDFADDAYWP